MPILRMPDGAEVDFGDLPDDQIKRLIKSKFPDAFPDKGGFVNAAKAGARSGLAAAETFGSAAAQQAGFPRVSNYLDEAAANQKAKAADTFEPTTGEDTSAAFDRGIVPGVSAAISQHVTEPLGGMAGRFGASMAGGAAGAAVGGPAGGVAGFFAPELAMSAGENVERQQEVNPNQDPDLLKATTAGLVQAAMARFGLGKFVSGALGAQIAQREGAKLAAEVVAGRMTAKEATVALGGNLRNIATETVSNAAVGTGMMVGTEAARRAQAGQELASPDALETYKDSAITAATLSPIFGGLHGVNARGKAEARMKPAEDTFRANEQTVPPEPPGWKEQQAAAAKKAQEQAAMAEVDARLQKQKDFDAQLKVDNLEATRKAMAEVQARNDNAPRRADAEAAFTQAMPDLTGEMRPEPVPPEAPVPQRRADEQPFLQPQDGRQAELPLNTPEPVRRAEESTPSLTDASTFTGLVRPRAAIMKRGDLFGHDMSTPDGATKVMQGLSRYNRSLIDSPKNAPEKEALEDRIDKLRESIDQMKRQEQIKQDALALQGGLTDGSRRAFADLRPDPETASVKMRPLEGVPDAKPIEPVATGSGPVPVAERGARNDDQTIKSRDDTDLGTAVGDMGSGGEAAGLPGELPAAGRGRAGSGAGPAGTDLRGTQTAGDALNAAVDTLPARLDARDAAIEAQRATRNARRLSPEEFARAKAAFDAEQTGKQPARTSGKEPKAQFDPQELNAAIAAAEKSKMGENPQDYAPAANADQLLPLPIHDAVVKGGKLADVMGTVAEQGSTPSNRALAVRLRDLDLPVSVSSGEVANDKGVAMGGHHDAAQRKITIDPARADEHVLLHEAVHAATVHAFEPGVKLEPAQRAAAQDVRKVFAEVQKDPALAKQYGLTNVKEFVAEAHTNPEFQQALQAHKGGLWRRFVDAVRRIIGMKSNTVLDRVLRASDTIMDGAKEHGAEGRSVDFAPAATGKIDFTDFPSSEPRKGHIEQAADLISHLPAQARALSKPGTKAWLENKYSEFVQKFLDTDEGKTRFTSRDATEVVGGKRVATARFLQQFAKYHSQVGRAALEHGYLTKNAEGSWDVKNDPNNLRTYLEAVSKLPDDLGIGGGDKEQQASAIHTLLTYHERETNAAAATARARQTIAAAKADKQAAKSLSGSDAAKVFARSNQTIANAKKVIERSQFTRPAGVTDANIAAALQIAQRPEVKAMLDIRHAINQNMLTTREQAGLNTPEQIAEWRKNKFYVPLYRDMGDVQNQFRGGGRGSSSTKSDKHFDGSTRDVRDTTSNLIDSQLELTRKALANDADLASLTQMAALPGNPAGVREVSKRPPGAHNVVTVLDKGEQRHFIVDDARAYRSFQDIASVSTNGVIKGIEFTTVLLREAVMLSPPAILRNMMRDSMESWSLNYTEKSLPRMVAGDIARVGKSMPAIMKEVRTGQSHRPDANVTRIGITGSQEYTSAAKEKEKIIYDFLREQNNRNPIQNGAHRVSRLLDAAHHALQATAAEAEIATRERVYNETLKRTGSLTEAASAAINTMDFRRRGDSAAITYAKVAIPFFNSQLQGVYKLLDVIARGDRAGMTVADARRGLLMKGMKMALASTAYSAIMSDNDDYKKLPKDVRDNSWPIPIGGGVFLRIPQNFEVAAVFKTMPQNIFDLMSGEENGREFKEATIATIMHNFMPSMVPQFVKPALEVTANHDFFTGRPLESDAQKHLAPQERTNAHTTSTAKALSSASGGALSPIMMDKLLTGYFASLGSAVVGVTDKIIEGVQGGPVKAETPLGRMPLVNSLTTDPLRSRSLDRYYELRGMTNEVAATFKKMQDDNRMKDAQEYLQEKGPTGVSNQQLLALNSGTKQVDKMLADARKLQHQIDINPSLSAAQKRLQKEQLTRRVNAAVAQQLPGLRKFAGE